VGESELLTVIVNNRLNMVCLLFSADIWTERKSLLSMVHLHGWQAKWRSHFGLDCMERKWEFIAQKLF